MSGINYSSSSVTKNDLNVLEDYINNLLSTPPSVAVPHVIASGTNLPTGLVQSFIISGFDFVNYQRNIVHINLFNSTGSRFGFDQSVDGGIKYYTAPTGIFLPSTFPPNNDDNQAISAYNDIIPFAPNGYRVSQIETNTALTATLSPPIYSGTALVPNTCSSVTIELEKSFGLNFRQPIYYRSNFMRGAVGVGFLEGATSQFGDSGANVTHLRVYNYNMDSTFKYEWKIIGYP